MCGKVYEGECLIHGPYVSIPDKKVKLVSCDILPYCYLVNHSDFIQGVRNRSCQTCPDGISIRPSKMPFGGLGAWAETDYKINSVFGPYEGVFVDKDDLKKLSLIFDGGYAWEVCYSSFKI